MHMQSASSEYGTRPMCREEVSRVKIDLGIPTCTLIFFKETDRETPNITERGTDDNETGSSCKSDGAATPHATA